jgi:hypothetical protein
LKSNGPKTQVIRSGAEGGIRTPTVLLPPAPQAGASASSATSAWVGFGVLIPDPASVAAGSCEPSVYATHRASDNDAVIVHQRRTLAI